MAGTLGSGERFDPAWLAAQSRRLLGAAATGPPPVLAILAGGYDDLSVGSAELLASRWVRDPAARSEDLRVFTPASDRWTVAELEQLLARTALQPRDRHVLVVSHASGIDLRGAEKLLKTLEEPPAATTFVLCVDALDDLTATLRGRADFSVEVEPAAESERVEQLVARGVVRHIAEEATRLSGRLVGLASVLAQNAELLDAARVAFEHPGWAGSRYPAADAQQIFDALVFLAGSWEEQRPVKRTTDRLSVSERARLRILTRRGFDAHRDASATLLYAAASAAADGAAPSLPGTVLRFSPVRTRLEALEAAQRQLGMYTPPRLVLAALLAQH